MPEFLDLKSGRLKPKTAKKEKSAEELALIDIKKMQKKRLDRDFFLPVVFQCFARDHPRWKQLVNDLQNVQTGLEDYNVRNCAELASQLQHRSKIEGQQLGSCLGAVLASARS